MTRASVYDANDGSTRPVFSLRAHLADELAALLQAPRLAEHVDKMADGAAFMEAVYADTIPEATQIDVANHLERRGRVLASEWNDELRTRLLVVRPRAKPTNIP